MNNSYPRSARIGTIVIALSFLLSPIIVLAQHIREISLSSGERVRLDNANGGFYSVVTKDGKIESVHQENPDEVVHLIVTFKDRPLAAYLPRKSSLRKTSMTSVYTTLQTSHSAFRAALNTIRQQLSAQMKSDYRYTIKREYYEALNGVALTCKRGMIAKIRALPMVEYVAADGEVKANLEQSVHQIRADKVQDSLGFTGKGILVGDIDTGIDYDNPALGGGFGPSFRVVGGYDFTNNDNDPMDDNGHGTHVAGIIGANGGDTLRGVAPEVKFLAVKVLDANGSGSWSDVIAGIDYCLDPDGNPATDDAVDVINMSLGGDPTPEDPVDSAVDNATKAGVLCVIAAGNNGDLGYGTVSSPGTSQSALTVGACDSAFSIASFSSEGPDPIHSSIKPEVVAPGVNILSTVLDNQTASWSGTSMATPHVAGTAALLKQEHPTWGPQELKAAIVNTAHSVGGTVSVFAQGNGCIDALDAAETKMVVEPGVMSFGYVDLAQDAWKDTLQLTVANFRFVSQNMQISVLDGPPSGATLTFDRTSFSIGPGQETTVVAILTVPSSVPILSNEPFAYLGKIGVTSDSDNVIIPFSFIKSTTFVINFDLPPIMLWLVNRVSGVLTNVNVQEGATKYIVQNIHQGDTFDLLADLVQDTLGILNYYLVHHIIDNPLGLTYVLVGHDEATIDMGDDTVFDIHNNQVPLDSAMYTDIEIAGGVSGQQAVTSYSMGWSVSPNRSRLFSCPLDSLSYITKNVIFPYGSDNYLLGKSIWGIRTRQDIVIATGPNNLFGYRVKSSYDDPYLARPSLWEKKLAIGAGTLITPASGGFETSIYSYLFPLTTNGNFYFNRQALSQGATNDKYSYSYNNVGATYFPISVDSVPLFWLEPPPTLKTPSFVINDRGEAVFEQKRVAGWLQGSAEVDTITSSYVYDVLKPGDTIEVEQDSHVNLPDYLTYVHRGSLFMRDNVDYWDSDSHGGIKQFNGVSESRSTMDPYWGIPLFTTQVFAHNRAQTNTNPFTLGKYGSGSNDKIFSYYEYDNMSNYAGTLHVLSDGHPYTILGQAGQSSVDCEYQIPNTLNDQSTWWTLNLLGASLIFPSFHLLQVSVNGVPTDIVRPDQTGIIRLVLFDHDNIVTSATISLVLPSGDEIDLPVSYVGAHEYDANVPGYVPSGFVDVVARIEDARGDEGQLTASPAFYFGNNTDNIELDGRLRMTSYALNNVEAIKMQTGDTLNYTLSYTNYGSDIARNVVVTFPTTPFFEPAGSQSWTLDSLAVNDTVQVPVSLLFLGRQQSSDAFAHYAPSLAWTTGGTTYRRNQKILVDFQNTITGVAQTNSPIPRRFELYQNFPNPFNPSTTIKYDLPKESRVKIVVYDILGREVARLVDEMKKAGSYQVVWETNRLASGVYFYRIEAMSVGERIVDVKKMLLVK